MTLDPSDLRLRIDEAFGGMPYPGDEQIVTHNRGDCSECERTQNALKGLYWRDLSFEILDHQREALTFMSPEGFRFYLPAFMIFSIMDYYRADLIPVVVVGRLTLPCASDLSDFGWTRDQIDAFPAMEPLSSIDWERVKEKIAGFYGSDEGEHWFFERVSGFNEAQCKVIRQFLEHMRDAHGEDFMNREPERAIERYWHLF